MPQSFDECGFGCQELKSYRSRKCYMRSEDVTMNEETKRFGSAPLGFCFFVYLVHIFKNPSLPVLMRTLWTKLWLRVRHMAQILLVSDTWAHCLLSDWYGLFTEYTTGIGIETCVTEYSSQPIHGIAYQEILKYRQQHCFVTSPLDTVEGPISTNSFKTGEEWVTDRWVVWLTPFKDVSGTRSTEAWSSSRYELHEREVLNLLSKVKRVCASWILSKR